MTTFKESMQLLSNAISYLSDAGLTVRYVQTADDNWRNHKLNEIKDSIYNTIQDCNSLLKSFVDELEDEKLPFESNKKDNQL